MRPSLITNGELDMDYAMKIGRVFVIVTVILANISRIIAIKKHFFYMINRDISFKANIIFTVTLLYIPS